MRALKHALCILALNILASVAIAQEETLATTTAAANPTSTVVEIEGRPVTEQELSSFSLMLENTEMRSLSNPEEVLDEYILTRLHQDLGTTAVPNGAESSLPTKYAVQPQRQLLRRALQEQIEQEVEIPRSDMQQWYENNISNYTQPLKVRAYHLFMETASDNPSSAPAVVRERIERVKRQADEGTSFGQLARQHSEASSGRNGGEIGWISPRMPIGPQSQPMNPRLEEALFGLEVGEASDVVQTSHGLHLLYAADKRTTTIPTLDDLITSNILPGAVLRDRLTSEIKTRIQETIRRHNGRVLETTASQDHLTTATPAYEFAGRTYTIADLEKIYGPRFTRAYQRVAGNPQQRAELMRQALEDEAMIQAAVDAGIDKKPEFATDLDLLSQRGRAIQRIQSIIAEQYAVTEEQVQAAYEKMKNAFKQPVADGEVLLIEPRTGSTAAETGKYREMAKRRADEAREKLENGQSFQEVEKWLRSEDVSSTASTIPVHALGQSTDTLTRAFDQATAGLNEKGQLSEVVQFGNDFAIARLNERGLSDPVPLENVLPRVRAMAAQENDRAARKELIKELEKSGKIKYLPGAARFGKNAAASKEE